MVEGYGQPSEVAIIDYGPLEFLGEIGLLTGQRAYLTAVAKTPGVRCGGGPSPGDHDPGGAPQ